MQKQQVINKKLLFDLFDYIFSSGSPVIYTHYSEFGKDLLVFRNSNDLKEYVNKNKNKSFFGLAIYYPEMRGYIESRRIDVDPTTCNEPSFRYEVVGWGLIYLYCDFKSLSEVECTVSVNSKKRAELWSDTILNLKDPTLWNWLEVQKQSKRIVQFFKTLA